MPQKNQPQKMQGKKLAGTQVKQPSLWRILFVDYGAFFGFIFPVILWLMYAGLYFYGKVNLANYQLVEVYAGLTVAALVVMVWRLAYIRRLFQVGVAVDGQIVDVFFMRDRGQLTFTYAWKKDTLKRRCAVHRVKSTRDLQKGDRVTILVDPSAPGKALITEIYAA